MGMGEHERDREKQSSVLFSLRELMKLEEERTNEEKERETLEREAQRRAKMEAELRMRSAEEGRLRENEARRRAEEAALREEAARHEAMRLAAAERGRLEAVQSAQLAAMELERKHERALAVIHTDEEKLRYKRVAFLGTGVFVMITAGVLGWYFGVQKPQKDAEQAALRVEIAAAQASADAAKKQADQKAAQIDELESALAKEKDLAKRGIIQNRLDLLNGKPGAPATPTIRPIPTVKPPPPDPTTAPDCDDKDPINPCLKSTKRKSG
jgi:colicin import membrane protein